MSTGQSYSGKGDSTTQPNENGSIIEQTVNTDLQTPKPSYNGGFKSSDILAFDALGDQRTLLTGLSQYWLEDPTKFRKLVEFLQSVPGDTPVDEKVRGVSFQDILNEPASPNKTRIPIPAFLEEVTESRDRVIWLRAYLQKVFFTYASSEYYLHESGEHEAMEWLDIHNIFARMIEQAAWQKLGEAPEQTAIPREIPERPFEWEGYAVYKDNPVNCTDVARLQEWVLTLQQMSILQSKAYEKLEQIISMQTEQVTVLKDTVANYRKMEALSKETIDLLQKRLPADSAPKAKAFLSLDLSVVVPLKGTSEVEIVTFALEEYRDSRKNLFEEDLKSGDFEAAYNSFTDARQAQYILDALRESAVELAQHNFHAATYNGDSVAFRKAKVKESKDRENDLAEFVGLHSVGNDGDVEEDEFVPMLDPEYYLDLTDDEKSVMSLLQSKGLSKEDLQRWAINFQNKHVPADSSNQNSTPPSDQPTPTEQ